MDLGQVSSVQHIMNLFSQLFVFTLDFCFELQYSSRPTHPKTKIAAGLEADIALGAMTAPPHRGEECHTLPFIDYPKSWLPEFDERPGRGS